MSDFVYVVTEIIHKVRFIFFIYSDIPGKSVTSLVAQMVKRLPTMRETQVRSLGWEDPLGKEMEIGRASCRERV